jgi:rod shape-determining protein MreC
MAAWVFWRRYPGLVVLLILEFVAFLFVSYQIQVEPRLSLLEKMGLLILGPIQHAGNGISDFVQSRISRRTDLQALRLENAQLRRQLIHMGNLETQLLEQTKARERLNQLLDLPNDPAFDYQYCSVIGKSDRHEDYFFIIDKGSWDGLRQDLGVISSRGVVGIVWEVTPKYSKVMSIHNVGCVVAAMLQDSRYHDAYMVGRNSATGRLQNVPNFLDVQSADVVVTSGLDGLFPKGQPVGVVLSSERTSQMFREIDIRFAAEMSRLEEVAVLVPSSEESHQ